METQDDSIDIPQLQRVALGRVSGHTGGAVISIALTPITY